MAFLWAVLIIILAGCRGSFDRPGEEIAKGEKSSKEIAYNPMALSDDYINVPALYPIAARIDTSGFTADTSALSPLGIVTAAAREDYRIQLFTSNTYGPAAKELNIAREVFDRPVYLDYEVPYYKVRVADFGSRREAEDYLPVAREAGYKNAWVVRISLNIEKLDDIYDDNLPPLVDTSDTGLIRPEPIDENPQYPED